jgi:hypothetical protein
MSLSTFISILSVLAIIVCFLQSLLGSDAQKRTWRAITSILLILNISVEIGKRIYEQKREEAAKQKDSEQRNLNLQLLSEVESLNKAAMEAFVRIDRALKRLPQASAASLGEEARQLKLNIAALTDAVHDGHLNSIRLQTLVDATRSGLRHLEASVAAQDVQPSSPERGNLDLGVGNVEKHVEDPTTSSYAASPPLWRLCLELRRSPPVRLTRPHFRSRWRQAA